MAEKEEQKIIDQYILLANNTKGKGIENLISHLLSERLIMSFVSFLNHPNIKELNSEFHESKKYYNVLTLFAFGTVKDYFKNQIDYPELSENQLKKLRKLTILEICAKKINKFSYDYLMKELVLSDSFALEEIFIESEYQDLLKCSVDQKNQMIQVNLIKGRDVKLGDVEEIEEKLKKIIASTLKIEENLKEKITRLNKALTENSENKKLLENEIADLKSNFQVNSSQSITNKLISSIKEGHIEARK